MSILIVSFFSPFSPEETKKNVLKQLEVDPHQIKTTEEYFKSNLSLDPFIDMFLFIGSGGTENYVAGFVEKSRIKSPIRLISYDLNNSLPAAMEIRAFLEKKGYNAIIHHDNLSKLALYLKRMATYALIRKKLHNSKIGLLGIPSEWLIASQINEEAVKEKWGIEIVKIPIHELINIKNEQKPYNLGSIGSRFREHATSCQVEPEKIIEAELATNRLLEIVNDYNLDAISVECFTFVLETQITSCLALSYLNDQEIIAGCEGDIPTTFTMYLLHLLTNKPVFMANVVDVDAMSNCVKLAHCTVPIRMLTNYHITTHFETDKSVAIRGNLPINQEVTILKIGGKSLTEWWVAKGKIIRNIVNESACRTQIEIELDEKVDYFLNKSIANHHCIVLGNYVTEINEFLKFSI